MFVTIKCPTLPQMICTLDKYEHMNIDDFEFLWLQL